VEDNEMNVNGADSGYGQSVWQQTEEKAHRTIGGGNDQEIKR